MDEVEELEIEKAFVYVNVAVPWPYYQKTKNEGKDVRDVITAKLVQELNEPALHCFRSEILKFTDGDTVTAMLNMGMHTYRKEKMRFSRIDAWETRGIESEKGKLAKAALIGLCEDREIIIETIKDKKFEDKTGKYGRYLAEIWVRTESGLVNANDWLVEHGHAVYEEY